jgi:carbamoyl-phosphate synthase large subunit
MALILKSNLADAENAKINYATNLKIPGPDRIWYIADAFRFGMSLEQVYEYSAVDPWFLVQIEDIIKAEATS